VLGFPLFGLSFRLAFCGRPLVLASAAASALFSTFATAAEPGAPRLPDLGSYGCAAVAGATPANVVHKGQIIEGRYHEWHEIYVDVNGMQRLACISMIVPRAEQLAGSAVRQFLTASLGIGQPPADAKARAQSSDVQQIEEPANVRPEPTRRVKPGAAPRADGERSTDVVPEAPPLPATQAAPEANTTPNATQRERGAMAPQDFIAEYETPAEIGVEDRQRVTNTRVYPWNTIGYLSVTYPNGQSFRCTAVLISPYVVLTAGHCVHNKGRGGYARDVRFYPAQYQNTLGDNTPQRPYGKSDFAFIRATEAWTQISDQETYPLSDYRHDFAAVQFRTPFTFTTTFMPVVYSSTATQVTNSGYPGMVQGVGNYGQWWDEGEDRSSSYTRNNHVKQYAIDGSGGNSGGPFFSTDAATGQNALVGLLSYADDQDDQAGGPWYDAWNKTLLTTWMNWTPSTAAAGDIGGLRVPGVFSSNHPSLFSYLRFFNGSSAAGTVEVTIADGNTGTALATWTSGTIAPNAMMQVGMRVIESQVTLPVNKPAFYTLSVRPTFTGYFQHAMHEPFVKSLTNLTSCDTGAAAQTALVMGVHSTRIEGYPSSVVVHNTSAGSTSVSLGIYDARNGTMLGTYQTGQIPPNGQKVVSAATLEANASPSWRPDPIDMAHYVVKPLSSFFTGYLQHLVHNEAVDTVADVTSLCRLAP